MPDDQPPLPGVAPAAGVNHHVFFAVLADADAGQKADRLCDEEMALRPLAGSKVRRERLHVTLVSLGWAAEFPERKALLARWAAAQVDAPPAFPLRLDRYLSFQLRNARRPLALCGHGAGVAGFMDLHRSLYGALDSAFSGGERALCAAPSVTPHTTLMYSPSVVEEHPVEHVGWTVREFQLIYNLRGSPAPYRVLGRWTLQDPRCM